MSQAAAEGSDSSAPQSTSAPSPTPTPTPDTHTAQRVLGGATQEDFQWAMAVSVYIHTITHTRAFVAQNVLLFLVVCLRESGGWNSCVCVYMYVCVAQVVHSRTFANAARGGGVGVRMLVPLVDMLNHAGDVTVSGRMDDKEVKPADNVRYGTIRYH